MDMDSQIPICFTASGNGKSKSPVISCVLTTIIATLLWSFCIIYIAASSGGSGAGIALLVMVFYLSLFASIPLGILNAYVISPFIARTLNMNSHFYTPILYNLLALVPLIAAIACIVMMSSFFPCSFGGSLNFFLLSLSPFLIPPLFAGSLMYSLRKLHLLKKHNI